MPPVFEVQDVCFNELSLEKINKLMLDYFNVTHYLIESSRPCDGSSNMLINFNDLEKTKTVLSAPLFDGRTPHIRGDLRHF